MRCPFHAALSLACALGCASAAPAPTAAPAPAEAPSDQQIAECRGAIGALGGALKSELAVALERGGTLEAIEVCRTRAPQIAEEISAAKGLRVGRVTAKARNPNNTASGWALTALQQFQARAAEGAALETLEFVEVAEHQGQRVLRYARPIGTQALCLACHGAAVDPALTARLGELYPADQAVGYRAGELRGAFVVEKPLGAAR